MNDSYNVHTGLPAAERLLHQVTNGAMAQKQADAKTIAELSKLVRDFDKWVTHRPGCKSTYNYAPSCNCGKLKLCDRADALLARLDAEQMARDVEPLTNDQV